MSPFMNIIRYDLQGTFLPRHNKVDSVTFGDRRRKPAGLLRGSSGMEGPQIFPRDSLNCRLTKGGMSYLPRDPDGPEVVIELRLVVAAHYKLGDCCCSSSNCRSSIKASVVKLSDFLPTTEVSSGEPSSATGNAGSESIGGSKTDLPRSRLFLGEVVATGAFVQGLSQGSLVIAIPGVGSQQKLAGKFLFCLFAACIPIPDPLLDKLLTCGGLPPEQRQLQQDPQQLQLQRQQALERALARAPHLIEGLECCTLKLRPREGDLLGICCSHVDQIGELLFWLLPFNVHIFIFAANPDSVALDKILSRPPLLLLKNQVFLFPLSEDLENTAMKVSGGFGLSQLLVTPSAAETLQQRLQQSNGGGDESSTSAYDQRGIRSIMTLLLLCLGPGGTLVTGCPLGGLDEAEAAAVLAKSAGVHFYNPPVLAVTQCGSQIHFLVEVLTALSEHAENPPGGSEAMYYSVKQAASALELIRKNRFSPLCLRVTPADSAC